MATQQHLLLSPAELAYLHSTLSLTPPIRPDGRGATQFRPLRAETGVLPGTNGSVRVCFADGTEAIVGVKAEIAKTSMIKGFCVDDSQDQDKELSQDDGEVDEEPEVVGENDWVEMTVEIPGHRDDDSSTVFLANMLSEALLADGEFTKKLWINRRFHWKLYLDIILISPPLSYPLPLLSLTTHLALLSTRLPRLKSEGDEDPMFDDDWAASTFIYPRQKGNRKSKSKSSSRPPITLLVMTVGDNIIFDPAKEELAVADSALAVSVSEGEAPKDMAAKTDKTGKKGEKKGGDAMDVDKKKTGRSLRLLSVRMIDPPSRLTPPGVPNSVNAAAWGFNLQAPAKNPDARVGETETEAGVWKAPRGGTKLNLLHAMVSKIMEKGGVADEVLDGLEAVELG